MATPAHNNSESARAAYEMLIEAEQMLTTAGYGYISMHLSIALGVLEEELGLASQVAERLSKSIG